MFLPPPYLTGMQHQDPTELGSNLSTLRCPKCDEGAYDSGNGVLPSNSTQGGCSMNFGFLNSYQPHTIFNWILPGGCLTHNITILQCQSHTIFNWVFLGGWLTQYQYQSHTITISITHNNNINHTQSSTGYF